MNPGEDRLLKGFEGRLLSVYQSIDGGCNVTIEIGGKDFEELSKKYPEVFLSGLEDVWVDVKFREFCLKEKGK